MYESYWKLDCKPFDNAPDPKFLYPSLKHEEALMRLLYTAQEKKQGALLTGDYGSGKTVISRVFLRELANELDYQTVLILNPKINHEEFLKEILYQLGVEKTPGEKLDLLHALEKKLLRTMEDGKKVIIVVDEAQILETEELEGFRLLLNLNQEERFLFSLILLGQTTLKKKVAASESLRQRLSVRYHLGSLPPPETAAYIEHRLRVAGRLPSLGPLFNPDATGRIHEASGGVPRRINNICDLSLLIGYSKQAAAIGAEVVEEAVRDLEEEVSAATGT